MNTDAPPSTIHPAVRIIIGACVAGAAGFGALVAWFIGVVVYTGCFISCGEPNRFAGFGLIILTAALVGASAAGIGYAIVGWQRDQMFRIWLIAAGIGAMLGVASLVWS
jgi:hypothetical protein